MASNFYQITFHTLQIPCQMHNIKTRWNSRYIFATSQIIMSHYVHQCNWLRRSSYSLYRQLIFQSWYFVFCPLKCTLNIPCHASDIHVCVSVCKLVFSDWTLYTPSQLAHPMQTHATWSTWGNNGCVSKPSEWVPHLHRICHHCYVFQFMLGLYGSMSKDVWAYFLSFGFWTIFQCVIS